MKEKRNESRRQRRKTSNSDWSMQVEHFSEVGEHGEFRVVVDKLSRYPGPVCSQDPPVLMTT